MHMYIVCSRMYALALLVRGHTCGVFLVRPDAITTGLYLSVFNNFNVNIVTGRFFRAKIWHLVALAGHVTFVTTISLCRHVACSGE